MSVAIRPSSSKPSPPVARRSTGIRMRREETAKIEIGQTTIRPALAAVLAAFFLVAIAAVPIAELAGARLSPVEAGASPWSHLSRVSGDIRAFLRSTSVGAEDGRVARSRAWTRLVSANRIVLAGLSGFERTLENGSLIGRSLRPPAQVVMTGWLGAGNERVYAGHDGWLFYRPDVEYVTGQGFLDRAAMRSRIATAPEWNQPPQPDPRPAIARFRTDLETRGIALIVAPTPSKPGMDPEKLARRYHDRTGVVHNPSYRRFVEDLRREGVLVFDPYEALTDAGAGQPRYLVTDTHWRPETMEGVAELLAAFITSHVRLRDTTAPAYRIERTEVRNEGDTARMLDLPARSRLFPPESVWIRRILQPDGTAWRSSRDADVLLLGDSFANVYSLESMGWGTSAGLVEQLSHALSRPVDRLVQNDQGAFATRAMLAEDPGRLSGKKVVVYQFAARELAFGDWKIIPLPDQQD